jgi:hypothetical protein
VAAVSPARSFYQSLGDLLYTGVYNRGLTIHMWFYCVGGDSMAFPVLQIEVRPASGLALGSVGGGWSRGAGAEI